MAVTELRSFVGLDLGETPAVQCRPSRISCNNKQMACLSAKIDELCNPFAPDGPASLVNLITGRSVSNDTQNYLLTTLQRGRELRQHFQDEWTEDSKRFLKPVKRVLVQNFAADHTEKAKKLKVTASESSKSSAENLRDMFARMVIVVAWKTSFDRRSVIANPITSYPLSLAHRDGSHMKTNKAALLQKLEATQNTILTKSDIPKSIVLVYDGGRLLHSVLSQTNVGASFRSIARTMLSVVLSSGCQETHICLDKYVTNSIKDSERRLREACDTIFVITGPEQRIRQTGQKLLANSVFKNEFAKFLIKEWSEDHYHHLFGGKTLIVSYGGDCYQYKSTENQIIVTQPDYLQGDHEEADTLIAFHINNISSQNIMVRASDSDVLVILIGVLGQLPPEERPLIIMDCGAGHNRRYISVTNIANKLDDSKPGLPRAIPAYHAFTGCDFTSAFYR